MKKYSPLLKLARQAIQSHFSGQELIISNEIISKYPQKRACFVTLTISGNLRGCIGSLYPQHELYKNVIENAVNAAFNDTRFPPLKQTELPFTKIEISILTIPKPLSYKSTEELLKKLKDKPGVLIKKGINSVTFLPQVWEQLPNPNDFLGHLCVKAGPPAQTWMNDKLEVYTYTVEAVEEKELVKEPLAN